MSKPKIVMTLAASIVVVLALASFNPTAYSQPAPAAAPAPAPAAVNATARPVTLIFPSGITMDFQATPDQLQAILIKAISSNLGQSNSTAIKENVAASLNATLAAADALKAAHLKGAGAGFQQPAACVETFGFIWCID
jgi:hypothetical protein